MENDIGDNPRRLILHSKADLNLDNSTTVKIPEESLIGE